MSVIEPGFNGFTNLTFRFFRLLEKNNNLEWFNKNRELYQNNIVQPAKAFVTAIGPFFNQLNPAIRTEPKFNATLMRLNKDMRFAKGAPYKNYFLIHFGRFKMDSEFYVYIDKTGLSYGLFLNNSRDENLYFDKNVPKFKNDLKLVFTKYGIDGKYNLLTFEKEPTILKKNFKYEHDSDLLNKTKFILLEKFIPDGKAILFKPAFLTEMIKAFSKLYPLYCFAITPDPLRLLEEFEENLGIAT
ncbi:MAG: DUF2461 family protein [Ignavibacteriales bacterium]|nr:MAG: DUF2461 family protein [Ignavibacteriales bacterium]